MRQAKILINKMLQVESVMFSSWRKQESFPFLFYWWFNSTNPQIANFFFFFSVSYKWKTYIPIPQDPPLRKRLAGKICKSSNASKDLVIFWGKKIIILTHKKSWTKKYSTRKGGKRAKRTDYLKMTSRFKNSTKQLWKIHVQNKFN